LFKSLEHAHEYKINPSAQEAAGIALSILELSMGKAFDAFIPGCTGVKATAATFLLEGLKVGLGAPMHLIREKFPFNTKHLKIVRILNILKKD